MSYLSSFINGFVKAALYKSNPEIREKLQQLRHQTEVEGFNDGIYDGEMPKLDAIDALLSQDGKTSTRDLYKSYKGEPQVRDFLPVLSKQFGLPNPKNPFVLPHFLRKDRQKQVSTEGYYDKGNVIQAYPWPGTTTGSSYSKDGESKFWNGLKQLGYVDARDMGNGDVALKHSSGDLHEWNHETGQIHRKAMNPVTPTEFNYKLDESPGLGSKLPNDHIVSLIRKRYNKK